MARLIACYKQPTDTAAFDEHYKSVHIPLARSIPGLRSYEISSGAIGSLTGPAPYYMMATLTFDSMRAIEDGLASPEGKATAQDLGNFAQAGVDLLTFE